MICQIKPSYIKVITANCMNTSIKLKHRKGDRGVQKYEQEENVIWKSMEKN